MDLALSVQTQTDPDFSISEGLCRFLWFSFSGIRNIGIGKTSLGRVLNRCYEAFEIFGAVLLSLEAKRRL